MLGGSCYLSLNQKFSNDEIDNFNTTPKPHSEGASER